ncbi:MAG: IS110 family transposase, partial [Acidobacteria bacterium]|nr:IS110 family transposase [Acidobacteriota bacterium]
MRYGKDGREAEAGRYLTEPSELAEESDPSRTEVPETVAPASAGSTRRRISSLVLTPASLVQKRSISMIRKVMEVIYQCVAGLDVHKETVVACRRRLIGNWQVELEIETFRTTSAGLRALAGWLLEWGVTHVAMESTGVYWVPVWNVLEGQFTKLLLVNAQHLKKVPGKKDDQSDAEWIAQCMQ